MIPSRDEVKRQLREGKDKLVGLASGRKHTQISKLTPEDMKSLDELNEKIVDNEMERLRLMHQVNAIQHKTSLLGSGWWNEIMSRYNLPYCRDYDIAPDGTVFILD